MSLRIGLFIIYCLVAVNYFCSSQTLSAACDSSPYSFTNTRMDESNTLAFYQSLAPSASNLLALFTFDNFSSGNGEATNLANGNVNGMPCSNTDCVTPVFPDYSSPGICGKAPQFSHGGHTAIYVDQDLNPGTRPTITWGAWVKPSYLTQDNVPQGCILSSDNGNYDRKITTDIRDGTAGGDGACPTTGDNARITGHFAVNLGDSIGIGGVEPTSANDQCRQIPDNEWHFVAATYNQADNTMTFYVGQSEEPTLTSRTYTTAYEDTAGDTRTFWTIGTNPCTSCDSSLNGEYFQGLIDEVFLYSVVLSADQIQQIYDFTRGGCKTTVVENLSGNDFTITRDGNAGLVIDSEDGTLFACPDINGRLRDICSSLPNSQ